MDSKQKYKTKQREIMLEYLKSVQGVHFTARDVCDYFRERGDAIGQSTVYRRLESLVDEGIINKYIVDGSSPACFEYVGEEKHADSVSCVHFKCEKCGKVIHLSCSEIEELQAHLLSEHRFKLNPVRTVFYGLCEDCL
ncbi:MAG: transcriptional repressor [Clostridia bacterium]|nr:transcriptional repressor [Clostridia bacterium]